MSFKWPNKDPDETLDYTVDWSRFLGYDHATSTGNTIANNSWFIDDASGVKTSITYKITSQITDSSGLISERVIRLRIKEN